jgi:spermidine synthase
LYDVIEMDPLNPRWAYSGHLYSVEFFQLCLSRLKPGGIVCMWAPTPRVRRSFAAAFPHCVEFQHGTVMVGSGQPMPLTVRTWAKRLKSPAVSAYLGEGTTGLVLDALWSAQAHEAVPGDSNLNWDLFPRDEFSSPEN